MLYFDYVSTYFKELMKIEKIIFIYITDTHHKFYVICFQYSIEAISYKSIKWGSSILKRILYNIYIYTVYTVYSICQIVDNTTTT